MKERPRIALACCCALLAFAANSLLARSALRNRLIDAGNSRPPAR